MSSRHGGCLILAMPARLATLERASLCVGRKLSVEYEKAA
jgi:hypothetical protein